MITECLLLCSQESDECSHMLFVCICQSIRYFSRVASTSTRTTTTSSSNIPDLKLRNMPFLVYVNSVSKPSLNIWAIFSIPHAIGSVLWNMQYISGKPETIYVCKYSVELYEDYVLTVEVLSLSSQFLRWVM